MLSTADKIYLFNRHRVYDHLAQHRRRCNSGPGFWRPGRWVPKTAWI